MRSGAYGRAGRSLAATTSKVLLTWTSSVPALDLMWDSYGALPSEFVSARTIVAPGYLARTACSTFCLVSPVSGVPAPVIAAAAEASPAAAAVRRQCQK
jgi:hypothetical protein